MTFELIKDNIGLVVMKHDGDILSKFKLLTDTTMTESTSRRTQNQRTLDIFDGFLQDKDDPRQDIFGNFLRRSTDVKPKNYILPENIADLVEADLDKAEDTQKERKEETKKLNFLQKAINSLLNNQSEEKVQKASELSSSFKEKESKEKKTSFELFADNIGSTEAFLLDVPDFESFEMTHYHSEKKTLNTSLISTVAKISVNYKTDNMEDIIKSDKLSDTELFELFVNYVKKSVDESSESANILNDTISKVNASQETETSEMKLDRSKLEDVFIAFINETSKSGSADITNTAVSQLVVEFAAAINTDYMTRDELQELFVRFSRNLSIKHPAAFKELSSILSNALPIAFTPDDGSAMRSAEVVSNFRSAIDTESMTRDQLEEIFIRFVREVSINAPGAWNDMQSILSNAISNAYSPDVSMDDSSRAAIAGFSLAISPENMTREELEELFVRFSREVSTKFPAAWAELQGIFSNALPSVYTPDTTMDAASRTALDGFSQAIKPEFMTRATLEELFTRFVREISANFPAAWAEMQSLLSIAVSSAFVPDMTMDDSSRAAIAGLAQAISPENMTREEMGELFVRFAREISTTFPAAWAELQGILSAALPNAFVMDTTMDAPSRAAIAGFELALTPESMKREEMEELFTRFVREVSVSFPAAMTMLSGLLAQALPNAYVEPLPDIDNYSMAVIGSFETAIKPESMTRDELQSVFMKFVGQISVQFPAAHQMISSVMGSALARAFTPDITMDDSSRAAISGFSQVIKPEIMTRDTLEELFIRFSREISIAFPAAWAEIQGMLSAALSNAYTPDVTMDDSSRAAISGFSQSIKPEFMTRDELEELFVRFSREVSVSFPAAWSELQGILNTALPNAFAPDTTMDDSSRSAIAGFSLSIKPEIMTRDELEELFVRFSREVSVSFPAAWNQLQGMLSVAVANAFAPDTTMDDSSRSAISGFSQAIKPEFMTRDELEELFVRFSREISIKFPAAWAELQGSLNSALPHALVLDTSMDDSSRSAIAGFSLAIKPDVMTREQLETMFLRFTREISVKFPAAWAELQAVLNNALPHAFVPDTTMDSATKSLVDEFESTITAGTFTEDQLEDIFADYMRQVPLMFPVVKSIIETTATNKRGDAEYLDKGIKSEETDFEVIDKDFKQLSRISNDLNLKAQDISKDLRSATNKDDIKINVDKLQKIQAEKSSLDSVYSVSKLEMDSNAKAINNISDDYTQKLDLSYDKKDDRSLFEIDTKKLSSWDMLRMLRRGEVLDVMNDMPKDKLADCLYVVPKYLLKQALVQLPVEDMCRVLFNARFPEALLRAMPRSKAIELLPSADQMLPILMNMGQIQGFKNGCDLLEEVIVKGMGVEPEQNPTRTEEEILPFVMEQLIGKTPRNADAVRPVQGKQSPIDMAMADVEADSSILDKYLDAGKKLDPEADLEKYSKEMKVDDKKKASLNEVTVDKDQKLLEKQMKVDQKDLKEQKLELKYRRPESLKEKQLESMAQDTIKNMSKDESQQILGAKRGSPTQMLEFLESMKKVKDLAGAKMAVSVLSNAQQKALAKAALPLLETKHIVKISQNYGMSSAQMVKEMPRYAVEGLIKSLPKHYMIEGFKLLDKSMMIGMLRTQSSQTIARVASESLSRNAVKDVAFKKKGFV